MLPFRLAFFCAGYSVLCGSSYALPAPAQGQVHIVDDGPNSYGGGWIFDLAADGSIDDLSTLPMPDPVSDFDGYATAVTSLGDLDGNGAIDLAVGAPGDDRAGRNRGAVWILYFDTNDTIQAQIPLRPGWNLDGLQPPVQDGFGSALACLGDMNGDGSIELAVGASKPTSGAGKVWILSVEPDGSVTRETVIPGTYQTQGEGLASLGDFNGNGVQDLGVGIPGANRVHLLWGMTDGSLQGQSNVAPASGVDFGDAFGTSLAILGDVNADGVDDLAVGAIGDDDGGSNSGAVWIVFLDSSGFHVSSQKISKTVGGLGTHPHTAFGADVAALGDHNSDGVPDLIVGASGGSTGAVFVLHLNSDGTVQSRQVLTSEFTGVASGDMLGATLANLGDWDGDGRPEIGVGAVLRDGSVSAPDFTDINAALSAAASGDTLLVRGGVYELLDGGYPEQSIDGRSLSIQAWNPLNVKLHGGLVIRNLGVNQSVHLSGLMLFGALSGLGMPLEITNSAGRTWIDGCVISQTGLHSNPGLVVGGGSTVIVVRSQIYGTNASYSTTPADPGLLVSGGSSVFAYDSTFTGARGVPLCSDPYYLFCSNAQDSGPGIRTSSGDDLFLSGCTAQGGTTSRGPCGAPGVGLESNGVTRVLDSILRGGGACGAYPAAADYTGPIEFLDGAGLSMVVNSPTRENEQTLFSFRGPPGVTVYVRYSLASGALYRPGQTGVDLLGQPRVVEFQGETDASGILRVSKHLGFLPPGDEILRLFAQSYYIDPDPPPGIGPKTSVLRNPPRVRLGTGVIVTRLDGGL